jgi:hypothetical protein
LSLIFFYFQWIAEFRRILTEEKGLVKKKYNLLWRGMIETTIYGGKGTIGCIEKGMDLMTARASETLERGRGE